MTKSIISVKIHQQRGEVMIAACDEDLLDKNFEEGELQLLVHSSFYDGFRTDEEDFIKHLNGSSSANLVGETVINCALKAGLITDESIIHIQGIPHAQIYRMT